MKSIIPGGASCRMFDQRSVSSFREIGVGVAIGIGIDLLKENEERGLKQPLQKTIPIPITTPTLSKMRSQGRNFRNLIHPTRFPD